MTVANGLEGTGFARGATTPIEVLDKARDSGFGGSFNGDRRDRNTSAPGTVTVGRAVPWSETDGAHTSARCSSTTRSGWRSRVITGAARTANRAVLEGAVREPAIGIGITHRAPTA